MHAIYDQHDFPDGFYDDILIAMTTIMILAPFLTLSAIERMIPSFKKAIARGVRICVFIQKPLGWENRRGLSEFQLAKVRELENGIRLLESIGVHVTMRKHVHVKIAVIDMYIYWHGSLNMMSFNPNLTDDEMTREENVFEALAAVGRQKLDKCQVCIELRRKVRREDFVVDTKLVGRQLAAARRISGISQKELAQQSMTEEGTIQRIETGRQIPQVETLTQIAGACGHHLALLPDYILPFIEKFLETASYAFPDIPEEQSTVHRRDVHINVSD